MIDASRLIQLAASHDFVMALGMFYINWAKIELLMDLAICKFLDISPTQAHAVTAAIEFGRRAFWLRSLINESDRKNKGNLIRAVNGIQNDSKRNIFSHSYLSSDENTVTFVERNPHGKFTVRRHRFTKDEFSDHVNAIDRVVAEAALADHVHPVGAYPRRDPAQGRADVKEAREAWLARQPAPPT